MHYTSLPKLTCGRAELRTPGRPSVIDRQTFFPWGRTGVLARRWQGTRIAHAVVAVASWQILSQLNFATGPRGAPPGGRAAQALRHTRRWAAREHGVVGWFERCAHLTQRLWSGEGASHPRAGADECMKIELAVRHSASRSIVRSVLVRLR